MPAKTDAHQVTARHGSLQFGRSAQRDDAAMIDDGEALAEGVGFFHVVRGEQNGFAAAIVFANDLPQQQAGLRIKTSAWFIEEKHLRIVHHGAGDRKTLHHAAGKSANDLVGAVGEFEALEQRGRAMVALVRTEAEIGAVKNEDFARCQRKIEVGPLGHHADQSFDSGLFFPNVMFADPGLTSAWLYSRSEDPHGRGFPRAVGPQKAKNFACVDIERNSIERDNFRFRLLALAAFLSKREAARAGRERRRRVIDFAQFVGADAGGHVLIPLIFTLRKRHHTNYFLKDTVVPPGLRHSRNTGQQSWDDSRMAGRMSIQEKSAAVRSCFYSYQTFHA